MNQYIIGTVLILGIFFIYSCIVKPKKQIQQYRKMFEDKGYKVKVWSFKPLGVSSLSILFQDSSKGDAFTTYKKVYPHYDVAIGNYLHRPLIQILTPELRNQFGKSERQFNYLKLPMLTQLLKRAIGSGVVLSQGEQWKRKRKIMSDLFTFELIKQNYKKIAQICFDSMIQHEKNSQISPGVYEYSALELFSQMFSAITSELFLGGNCSRQQINGKKVAIFMIDLINDVNIQAKNPLSIIFGPKYLNIGVTKTDRYINERIALLDGWGQSYVDKRIQQEMQKINQQKEKYQSKDVISSFLKKKKQEQLSNFSKFQIFEEFKLFFLAGTDTTAHFTQMILYYLSKNPEVEKKLRQQITQFSSDQDYSLQRMKKLVYINAIQKQTTRMYGPTNFILPRKVIKDHYFKGIPFKKGVNVQFYSVGSHFNEEIYPNADSFKPQRWLDQNINSDANASLTGFGVGARSCPGKNIAMFQSKVALTKFMKRYKKFEVVGDVGLRWKFLYVPDDFKVRVSLSEEVKK